MKARAYKDSENRYRVFYGAACLICNQAELENLMQDDEITIIDKTNS